MNELFHAVDAESCWGGGRRTQLDEPKSMLFGMVTRDAAAGRGGPLVLICLYCRRFWLDLS